MQNASNTRQQILEEHCIILQEVTAGLWTPEGAQVRIAELERQQAALDLEVKEANSKLKEAESSGDKGSDTE